MRKLVTAVLGLTLTAPVLAQDTDVATWAPRWKPGDTWVVKTYLKDMTKEISSPKPAPGAMPRTEDPPQLPDYPPLRDGIPLGYKKGNRWRFTVKRLAKVRYEDDAKDDPPEQFWVVAVETLEGSEKRTAELWYARADLVLSKVVLHPGKKNETTAWTEGTAQVGLPAAMRLGLPLDWPDLRAAKKPKQTVQGRDQTQYEQRVRTLRPDTPQEEVQVKLTRVTSKREALPPAVRFSWKPGALFWSRMQARRVMGILEHS